ncbi:IS110 family transposase [Micromonospora krabiensis]|uniref:Transposase n=1 Tax=Micromonospora krabiensis TaxID=307121 RepID=A0A1C3MWJ1_9ACTN|nr:IS110 family transposase [Micromonospora krabiensis]SBV24695.1 Transposase [Micromonospora krabiensis]
MSMIIGMDPHKRSATIEVVDERGRVLATGRYGTDKAGYAEMLAAGRRYADRVWAVEGCTGIGKHIAHRLVHDDETVLDVPAKLSAQVRVFAAGNGRKTDPVDAHSVAMVALRSPHLVQVQVDADLQVMGMLTDRRDELGRARTQTINRLHRLLLELLPGGAKKFLSAPQARALIATVKPRDIVGKTRRRLAVELISELEGIDKKIKAAEKDLKELVAARGSTLMELHGIGPSGAARLLADVGDINRFADRDRFASWNGTAPLDASSGDQQRHRLSRAGNPADQPNSAHHGRGPAAQPHARSRLLRREEGRREDLHGSHARAEAPPVQRGLLPHGRRPKSQAGGRPGRALGDDSAIQRDRPDPGHRPFGQATSRTRHQPP